MKKVRLGIQPADILVIVFLSIGSVFTLIGIILALNINTMIRYGTDNVTFLPGVFASIGLPFVIIGLAALFYSLHRRQLIQKAVNEGQYVMADVEHIEQNTSVTVNGKNPFIVICRYQDPVTDDMHEFRSRNLNYYPKELLNSRIRVFVSQKSPKYYYVDIDDALSEEIHE